MVAAFVHLVVAEYRWFGFWIPHYYIFLILGLLVIGCGVAQFLKAREVRIKHEATP
ncbi:hypothetical protein ES703_98888 [subsurface metagenome]